VKLVRAEWRMQPTTLGVTGAAASQLKLRK
jgi:hypothetical protein